MGRTLLSACAHLVLPVLVVGCSSSNPYEPGPAMQAGQAIDRGIAHMKDATVDAYRKSKDWIYDTGTRIQRSGQAFGSAWSQDDAREPRRRQEQGGAYRGRGRSYRPTPTPLRGPPAADYRRQQYHPPTPTLSYDTSEDDGPVMGSDGAVYEEDGFRY